MRRRLPDARGITIQSIERFLSENNCLPDDMTLDDWISIAPAMTTTDLKRFSPWIKLGRKLERARIEALMHSDL